MSRLKFGICPTEGGRFVVEALAEVERAEALGLDSVLRWLSLSRGRRAPGASSPERWPFTGRSAYLRKVSSVAAFSPTDSATAGWTMWPW